MNFAVNQWWNGASRCVEGKFRGNVRWIVVRVWFDCLQDSADDIHSHFIARVSKMSKCTLLVDDTSF